MFGLLYIVLALVMILTAFFIVYHIIKFSFNKKQSFLMIMVFVAVFFLLLAINVFSFTQIDKNVFNGSRNMIEF